MALLYRAKSKDPNRRWTTLATPSSVESTAQSVDTHTLFTKYKP